jgi:hypothetical protein
VIRLPKAAAPLVAYSTDDTEDPMYRALLSTIVAALIGIAGLAPAADAANVFSSNSNAVPFAVADGLAYWEHNIPGLGASSMCGGTWFSTVWVPQQNMRNLTTATEATFTYTQLYNSTTYRYCAIVMNSTYGFTGNSWAAFCTDVTHEIGNLLGFKEQNLATWYDPQDVMEPDGHENISSGYGHGAVPAQCAAIPSGLHY